MSFDYVPETYHIENLAKILALNEPKFGYSGLGELVYQRTYARNGESWAECVERVVCGIMSIRKSHYAKNRLHFDEDTMNKLALDMAHSMYNFKWLPPGRGLWSMGTKQVKEHGAMCLNNCGFVSTVNLVEAVEWCMDALMNGVGVGFDTEWNGTLAKHQEDDGKVYVVEDSREGWVASVTAQVNSYVTGKNHISEFDYSKVRPRGSKISTGGIASGPGPLKELHTRIDKYCGYFLKGKIEELDNKPYSRTRFIADIFNAIGLCVVAGNIRRSSEICLGKFTDEDFMSLKNYTLNSERCDIAGMSNNSCVLGTDPLYQDFKAIPGIAKGAYEVGEPGMINMVNIRKYGRYGKTDCSEDKAVGINPCGEIPLESFELCNLAEVVPSRCQNTEDLYNAFKYATFYASTVSLLPTHVAKTNAVIARNRRIGVGVTGIAQWASGCDEQWKGITHTEITTILRKAYKLIRKTNAELNTEAGVPPAIRVTTVKPSGTVSLIAGVTPGVHYPFSRYCIRRVRVADFHPIASILKANNIPNEPDLYTANTSVFSFYIDHGDIREAKQVSPWEQFALVAMLQRCYSDNSVSASIYFDKAVTSLSDVEKMLAMYIPVLKSVSMFPIDDHSYAQAPYEAISEDVYRSKPQLPKINYSSLKTTGSIPVGERFCANDTCTL